MGSRPDAVVCGCLRVLCCPAVAQPTAGSTSPGRGSRCRPGCRTPSPKRRPPDGSARGAAGDVRAGRCLAGPHGRGGARGERACRLPRRRVDGVERGGVVGCARGCRGHRGGVGAPARSGRHLVRSRSCVVVLMPIKEHTYATRGVSSTSYSDSDAKRLAKNPPRCSCARPLVDRGEGLRRCLLCGRTVTDPRPARV